jgi:hypothetical protein
LPPIRIRKTRMPCFRKNFSKMIKPCIADQIIP